MLRSWLSRHTNLASLTKISVSNTHTIGCLPNTRAGVNFICLFIIRSRCASCIKRKDVLHLHTARKQLLPVDGLINVHLHLGVLRICFKFSVALHFAKEILFRTPFTDCTICGFLPVERKLVPCHLRPVVIVTHERFWKCRCS